VINVTTEALNTKSAMAHWWSKNEVASSIEVVDVFNHSVTGST
jgi:hypothetical protein